MVKLGLVLWTLFSLSTAYSQSRIVAVKALKPFSYSGCYYSLIFPGKPKPGNQILRYKITYRTVAANGQPTIASGLVAFTDELVKSRTVINYSHATVVSKESVPSRGTWEANYALCNMISPTNVIVAADYLGLGDSTDSFQSYLHLPSEVGSNIHLMEATEELLRTKGCVMEPRMIMTGYSQGAHVALATHKYLDEKGHRDWEVIGTVAMSGPFHLSELGVDALYKNPKKNSATLFTSLIIFSYQNIYGNLFGDVSEIFRPEFHDFFAIMASQNGKKIRKFLPDYPHELLTDAYIQDVVTDESHPLRKALQENNLEPWNASGEIFFVFSDGDKTVLSDNSHRMAEELEALGSTVHKQHVGKKVHSWHGFYPCGSFRSIFYGFNVGQRSAFLTTSIECPPSSRHASDKSKSDGRNRDFINRLIRNICGKNAVIKPFRI